MLEEGRTTGVSYWLISEQKVGNAVTRVQVKRYIRQAFLELKDEVKQDMDYVIIARTQAATLDFHETKKACSMF